MYHPAYHMFMKKDQHVFALQRLQFFGDSKLSFYKFALSLFIVMGLDQNPQLSAISPLYGCFLRLRPKFSITYFPNDEEIYLEILFAFSYPPTHF